MQNLLRCRLSRSSKHLRERMRSPRPARGQAWGGLWTSSGQLKLKPLCPPWSNRLGTNLCGRLIDMLCKLSLRLLIALELQLLSFAFQPDAGTVFVLNEKERNATRGVVCIRIWARCLHDVRGKEPGVEVRGVFFLEPGPPVHPLLPLRQGAPPSWKPEFVVRAGEAVHCMALGRTMKCLEPFMTRSCACHPFPNICPSQLLE